MGEVDSVSRMRGPFELAQEVLVHGHQLALPRDGKRQIEAVIGRMSDFLGKPISLPVQVARGNKLLEPARRELGGIESPFGIDLAGPR
jgi:hypothetical protein